MHFCLLIGQFVKNKTVSVQLSYTYVAVYTRLNDRRHSREQERER